MPTSEVLMDEYKGFRIYGTIADQVVDWYALVRVVKARGDQEETVWRYEETRSKHDCGGVNLGLYMVARATKFIDQVATELVYFQDINPGSVVKLSDGTFWRVAPDHMRIVLRSWTSGDEVLLRKDRSMIFPIRIANRRTGEEVGANSTTVRF